MKTFNYFKKMELLSDKIPINKLKIESILDMSKVESDKHKQFINNLFNISLLCICDKDQTVNLLELEPIRLSILATIDLLKTLEENDKVIDIRKFAIDNYLSKLYDRKNSLLENIETIRQQITNFEFNDIDVKSMSISTLVRIKNDLETNLLKVEKEIIKNESNKQLNVKNLTNDLNIAQENHLISNVDFIKKLQWIFAQNGLTVDARWKLKTLISNHLHKEIKFDNQQIAFNQKYNVVEPTKLMSLFEDPGENNVITRKN